MTDDTRFSRSNVRHGTPNGARLHSKRKEDACDACRAAKSAYDKRRTEATSDGVVMNRLRARAQGKAETALRKLHPGDYKILYEANLAIVLAEAEYDRLSHH